MIREHSLIPIGKISYLLSHAKEYTDPERDISEPSHIHDHIEIYLNVSGDVSFLVGDAFYHVQRGTVIVTRANEFHHCIYHSAGVHDHFCLRLFASAEESLFGFLRESSFNCLPFEGEEGDRLIAIFDALEKADEREDALEAEGLILQILAKLRRPLFRSSSERNVEIPEELRRILNYIHRHYGELSNVTELIEPCFISRSTLNRWFLKYLQVTPKAYLDAVKLSNARRMLDEGRSVTDVSVECGYADSSHFIRVFKGSFGVTPRQYKNQ